MGGPISVNLRELCKLFFQEHSGFWNSLFYSGDSARTQSSRRLVSELLTLMKDSDSYVGTHFMPEMEDSVLANRTGNETFHKEK